MVEHNGQPESFPEQVQEVRTQLDIFQIIEVIVGANCKGEKFFAPNAPHAIEQEKSHRTIAGAPGGNPAGVSIDA